RSRTAFKELWQGCARLRSLSIFGALLSTPRLRPTPASGLSMTSCGDTGRPWRRRRQIHTMRTSRTTDDHGTGRGEPTDVVFDERQRRGATRAGHALLSHQQEPIKPSAEQSCVEAHRALALEYGAAHSSTRTSGRG